MIVISEMQNGGVFEAASKKKLTAAMIRFYAQRDQDPAQIKAVFCVKKDGKTDEFCKMVVDRMQEIVEDGVKDWRKQADQEYRCTREIESDYREACL